MAAIDGPTGGSQAGLLGVLVARGAAVRARLDRVNIQASSGKVGLDYAALGGGALAALDLRPRLAALAAWQANIDAAATRMSVARTALGGIQDIASDLLAKLNALNGLNPPAIDAIAAGAREALAQVADLLNSQAAGVHVFAGEDAGRPPVPDAERITQSGFYGQIAAAVAGLGTNGAAATAAATLAIAASDDAGTTPFSAYLSGAQAAPVTTVVEVGEGQRIRTGVLASANAAVQSRGVSTTGSYMRDVMRVLASVGALSGAQADDPGLSDLVRDLRTCLSDAIGTMAAEVGVLGDAEARLTTIRSRHGDTQVALAAQLSRVEDVDMAATLSRLAQLESQLQVSYRLISGSNNLSLVKFLGSA